MKYVIQRLLKAVDVSRVRATLPPPLDNIIPSDSSSSEITHAWMWPLLGQWLKELDVIITETFVSFLTSPSASLKNSNHTDLI